MQYVGYDELIRDVFLQLVEGVQWLHSLGIAHRDIKPENIVCSCDGTRVRICDFGLATSEIESSEFGCGSTFYIAPGMSLPSHNTIRSFADVDAEAMGDWFPEDTNYATQQGDIWSLGVILVNLVCGRNPWRMASPSDESFTAFLADPNFLRRILPISEQCLFVLSRIFTIDPCQRISLDELRDLILQVETFTMNEEELRRVHLAAQSTPTPSSSTSPTTVPTTIITTVPAYIATASSTACTPIFDSVANLIPQGSIFELQDWAGDMSFNYSNQESVFVFEDQETPSLLADSGSPSPPNGIFKLRFASSYTPS